MTTTNVFEYFYGGFAAKEWERLERHRTEFAVTVRTLRDWLLPSPATLLDIGGGPGRHAIALAQRGYDVTLLDLAQGNLAFARVKAKEAGVSLRDFVHGNALNLSTFQKRSFDAVLLMGPLYHLLEDEERRRAVTEAMCVLK